MENWVDPGIQKRSGNSQGESKSLWFFFPQKIGNYNFHCIFPAILTFIVISILLNTWIAS